ncbi:MAG: type II toxin-antitoxin system RelE/ParE family toxin [Peptococcaceae bacterium]|jgi:plasmid stabilization system protein ParE|nr:type II toxin-antitoxin system RelE/ParE family toxin [Peptococcaceae bacterium]
MRHYEIQISDKANGDMEAIYKYIAETLLAPDTAANQYDRIAEALISLEEMPDRIKLIDSEPEHSKGLRSLIVDSYSIFFIIKFDIVFVTRVLYSASNISKRLSEE